MLWCFRCGCVLSSTLACLLTVIGSGIFKLGNSVLNMWSACILTILTNLWLLFPPISLCIPFLFFFNIVDTYATDLTFTFFLTIVHIFLQHAFFSFYHKHVCAGVRGKKCLRMLFRLSGVGYVHDVGVGGWGICLFGYVCMLGGFVCAGWATVDWSWLKEWN